MLSYRNAWIYLYTPTYIHVFFIYIISQELVQVSVECVNKNDLLLSEMVHSKKQKNNNKSMEIGENRIKDRVLFFCLSFSHFIIFMSCSWYINCAMISFNISVCQCVWNFTTFRLDLDFVFIWIFLYNRVNIVLFWILNA